MTVGKSDFTCRKQCVSVSSEGLLVSGVQAYLYSSILGWILIWSDWQRYRCNFQWYSKQVETRMQEEAERARQCLDPTTEEKIVKVTCSWYREHAAGMKIQKYLNPLYSSKLTILLCIQIFQKELTFNNMKTVIEMENSGVNHMLKHNKIEGLFRFWQLFPLFCNYLMVTWSWWCRWSCYTS